MKALARIVAEADGRGGTRLAELYGEAPLLPRRAYDGSVHLVGGAAGPLGGDELCLELHVGPGATLVVRTVAASIALPGAGPSLTRLHATVADGATLHWLPEPVIAARGCDHRASSTVELSGSARLRWREELVCGRHGEPSGDLVLATTVTRDGRTVYRHDLAVGPRAPGWDGPAGLGGAPCYGCVVVVDDPLPPPSLVEGGSLVHLAAAGAAVAAAVTPEAYALRHALTTLTHPDPTH